jgi:molecular chaperone GrpE
MASGKGKKEAGKGTAIEELRQEAGEYKELAQRIQAEFDNYRKRSEKMYEERVKFCSTGIIKEILPVVDSVEEAVKHAQGRGQGEEEFSSGLKRLKGQLMKALQDNGLSEIRTKGEWFNPEFHECALTKNSPEKDDGIILEELRKGYLIHNKVLRPAMVAVNKKDKK